ncbi:MAG: SixA phosphatase family protein [Angustibacter sp.]
MRRLVLIRHAKAERDDEQPDRERALSPRGRRDAAALGRWLAEHVGDVDLVLCSTARRTRQTCSIALGGHGWRAAAVDVRDELYLASPGDLLEVIHQVDDAHHVVVAIGHEPTQSVLARALAGEGSDPAALAVLDGGLVTSGVVVFELAGTWPSVVPATAASVAGAQLVQLAAPRG